MQRPRYFRCSNPGPHWIWGWVGHRDKSVARTGTWTMVSSAASLLAWHLIRKITLCLTKWVGEVGEKGMLYLWLRLNSRYWNPRKIPAFYDSRSSLTWTVVAQKHLWAWSSTTRNFRSSVVDRELKPEATVFLEFIKL